MLIPPTLDEMIVPNHPVRVVVFGYLSNIYSGRKMEAALKENIHFMWISGMSQPGAVALR